MYYAFIKTKIIRTLIVFSHYRKNKQIKTMVTKMYLVNKIKTKT